MSIDDRSGMTWEKECKPSLHFVDPLGHVAIIVLWNKLSGLGLPALSNPSIGVVGNLRTPVGIGWFLRGLGMLPNIKTVLVWGSDLCRTGDALFNIWEKGITPEHVIADFKWQLDELIPVSFVDEIREGVRLIDVRGNGGFNEVVERAGVGVCNTLANRKQVEFPPVPIPKRSILTPRSSPIVMSTKGVADGYLQVLNAIYQCGVRRKTRKKETITHWFEVVVSFPAPREEILSPCFDFTQEDLETYCTDVLSPDPPPDGIDYRYGERIFGSRNGCCQFREVAERLKKSLDTKRSTIAVLDPVDLGTLRDAPCLAEITFAVCEGELNMSCIFRSHDIYGGWPSNVFAMIRVYRLMLTELSDLDVSYGRVTFLSQNAQIYERHLKLVDEKLEKYWITLEKVNNHVKFEQDPVGVFSFSIEDHMVKVTMMNATGDEILWRGEHKSPTALIKYIVAIMPWLDSQHIRYLGGEEAKLLFSLKNKTPYVQG